MTIIVYCARSPSFFFSWICSRAARRKQRAEESDDEQIASEEEDYSSSDDESTDSDEGVLSCCEVENAAKSIEKPVVQSSSSWHTQSMRLKEVDDFKSVDGSKIFFDNRNTLVWEACTLLAKGQKALIAKQDDINITAQPNFRRKARLTQVPFRKFHLSCHLFWFILSSSTMILTSVSHLFSQMIRCFHPMSTFPQT